MVKRLWCSGFMTSEAGPECHSWLVGVNYNAEKVSSYFEFVSELLGYLILLIDSSISIVRSN